MSKIVVEIELLTVILIDPHRESENRICKCEREEEESEWRGQKLEIQHDLILYQPKIKGSKERNEYDFRKAPEHIQGIVHPHWYEIVRSTGQGNGEKDDARDDGEMYSKPLISQEIHL